MCGALVLSDTESFRYQIIMKYITGKIYRDEAATLLKLSERSISRIAKNVREKGFLGVKNGNFGRSSNRKIDPKVKETILRLKKEEYFDFNCKHFYDILVSKYKFKLGYTTLWNWLKAEKLVKHPHRQRRRKKHVFRPRMPQEGLLLQMDGSHHKFNGKDNWVLISVIDDATSEIPYAEFFKGETTINCMKVLKKVIEIKGVPKAIYTDKAGWAGGNKRTDFSQFQRACDRLGIQIIYANSPQAKGRIERSFRTIQDRLIPELRHNKITSMKKANKYLQDIFLKEYWNKKHTIMKPLNEDSAYEPLDPFLNLENILCVEESRVIGSDQTVYLGNKRYVVDGGARDLSRYELVIRTGLDLKKRSFVMENEVNLKPVDEMPIQIEPTAKRGRFKALTPETDPEIIEALDRLKTHKTPIPYHEMLRAIDRASKAVWDHQITGKPLKIKSPLKKRAA